MNDADTEYRITQLETLLAYAEDAATKGRLARENAAGMEMQIAELQTAHSDLSIEFDRLKLTLVELRNENEQLRQIGNDAIAETSKLRHELVELWKDHKSLKSWKESIRAEVGSEPSPRGYSNEYEYMSALEQHYRHRAEHLAAKLVEAQKRADRVASWLKSITLIRELPIAARCLVEQGIEQFDQSQPQPLPGGHDGPDFEDGPEFEGWAERSGQPLRGSHE